MGLIKFLAPSRPFVVYSQYKEVILCFTPTVTIDTIDALLNEDNYLSKKDLSLVVTLHWFLLLKAPVGNVLITVQKRPSLSPAGTRTTHHVPLGYYLQCAFVVKKIILMWTLQSSC